MIEDKIPIYCVGHLSEISHICNSCSPSLENIRCPYFFDIRDVRTIHKDEKESEQQYGRRDE